MDNQKEIRCYWEGGRWGHTLWIQVLDIDYIDFKGFFKGKK